MVRYVSSTYTAPGFALVQERTSQISVICGARSLRIRNEHHGVLEIMESAIQALTMFKIDGERIHVQDDEFIREEKGVWWYGFTVVVPTQIYYHTLKAAGLLE